MTVLKQQMQKAISTNPIQDMTFRGLHWIEASAGTGKTYTLSSLMVRIFLDQYYPHQVIATTFTRKATAELKNRVRLRVEAISSVISSSILWKLQRRFRAKLILYFSRC